MKYLFLVHLLFSLLGSSNELPIEEGSFAVIDYVLSNTERPSGTEGLAVDVMLREEFSGLVIVLTKTSLSVQRNNEVLEQFDIWKIKGNRLFLKREDKKVEVVLEEKESDVFHFLFDGGSAYITKRLP